MHAMHQALSATEPTRSRRVRHCFIYADEVMEPTWIVLANESRLRVFELQVDGLLHEIVDFLSPKGKMRSETVLAATHQSLLSGNNSASGDAIKDGTLSAPIRQGICSLSRLAASLSGRGALASLPRGSVAIRE